MKRHTITSMQKKQILVLLLFLLGIFVRVFRFCQVPNGINQDEAYAGYEAFSMLNYGTDSNGYRNPCYFISWGSGMNVLESYLAMPWIRIFGLNLFAIRFPQFLCACLCLPVFYLLLRELFSPATALWGLGLLTISPWHIMMSRWGLESNLAPAFLLFGFYFLVLGIRHKAFWMISAFSYGIALYSYALAWPVVFFTLLSCGCYLLFSGQLKQKHAWLFLSLSVVIFLVLALPLLLCGLVNKGLLPEIRTSWISIPKMPVMRDSELSLRNLLSLSSWKSLLNIVLWQDDGRISNVTERYGLFYRISLPFILLGGVRLGTQAWQKLRAKSFSCEFLVLLGMFSSVFTCLLVGSLNVNRANSLHFFTLILLALGVQEFLAFFSNRAILCRAVAVGFALLFCSFTTYYFTSYAAHFQSGIKECVTFVKNAGFASICYDDDIYYPQILFSDQTPTPIFLETVQYANPTASLRKAIHFGRYTVGVDPAIADTHKAYILACEDMSAFIDRGFTVKQYGDYAVAYTEDTVIE